MVAAIVKTPPSASTSARQRVGATTTAHSAIVIAAVACRLGHDAASTCPPVIADTVDRIDRPVQAVAARVRTLLADHIPG